MIRPITRVVAACSVFVLAAVDVAAAACPAPESWGKPAASQPFKQERVLKGMSRPLVSEGVVEISADAVVWRVASPVAIVTRITSSGITQSVDGGPEQKVGPATANNPFLTETGLMELVRGDLSKLNDRFEVERKQQSNMWKLGLKPKSAQLSTYITRINVEGCKQVDAIRVEQANGDAIAITFRPPK